ncbi:uncharacterized protein LOC117288940 [Asterias rubens]|uniref:uncharacterized protein LOC117288940 n=1 Tax=Asterias rubens TaxID=7604 RepID=UPI0014556A83|nr:uncharacterized protein LOC117288940 [Asterias rubens]
MDKVDSSSMEKSHSEARNMPQGSWKTSCHHLKELNIYLCTFHRHAGTACFRRDMMQSLVVPQKRWDAARRQSSVPCHALMCNLMNNAYFFLRGTSQSTVVPDPGLIKAFCRQWCSSSLPLSVCTVCSREPACQRIKGGNRRETHAQLPGVSSPPKHPASSHDDNLPV